MRSPSLLLATLIACGQPSSSNEAAGTIVDGGGGGPRILPDHSIVIVNPTVLARFAFTRTMTQLVASVSDQRPANVYQAWMGTYGYPDCRDPYVDPDHYGQVCPRVEFVLQSTNPFTTNPVTIFAPVALFNRFDLAPTSGANCGEYRIVYAKIDTPFLPHGRAFFSFDGVLPNPSPHDGLAGCRPIAQFWADRSNDANWEATADALEALYYGGTAVPGVRPVVHAASYGLATTERKYIAGQIRANMFIEDLQWNLREFKTRLACTAPGACQLTIDHVSAKNSLADELFAGTASLTAPFQTAFTQQLASLAEHDVSKIGMAFSTDHYNEYESVPDTGDVAYDRFTTAAFRTKIQAALDAGPAYGLTVDNVLRRATTQTCAGCHQVANTAPENQLGGATWPPSLGFVHVDEQSHLSQALMTQFILHRMSVLSRFLAQAVTPDDGLTIGGRPVGAPD